MKDVNLALRLALRELRGRIAGFRIFVVCLFLGVMTIASIGSLSQALLEGLQRDGRALLGGDLDLRLVHREAGALEEDWLRQRFEVSRTAQMRAMLRRDLPPDLADNSANRQLLVELKAVDDLYPLYGEVLLAPARPLADALAKKDGRWGLLAESAV
ncbi:MAG: ABC transporter permease, partial [Kiloniellales bacterium]|nr:ABC transporter permease [Kiloniellales bacterium]